MDMTSLDLWMDPLGVGEAVAISNMDLALRMITPDIRLDLRVRTPIRTIRIPKLEATAAAVAVGISA
jgi:hypothetical protein